MDPRRFAAAGGQDIDLGDHVGVTGEVITTQARRADCPRRLAQLTSKSIRPLPDKHKGLTDPEARVRARYVDLIIRPGARDVAYARATVVRSVRDSLAARGFTEVETPILQLIHGGANARPFETHINAYDLDLYLRIATELHLKRLIVGGMEKVFEIGRQFRNEGVDFKHNPEFTSMEVYETYGDYNTMRVLTQQIIQEAATAVYGSPMARRVGAGRQDHRVRLLGRLAGQDDLPSGVGEHWARRSPLIPRRGTAPARSQRSGSSSSPNAELGTMCWRRSTANCARATTTTPVFYTDFPKENSPLDPRTSRRSAASREVGPGDLRLPSRAPRTPN